MFESLIFIFASRRRWLESFNFFWSIGGGGSEIPSLRRRRLKNFKIFVRYGGGGGSAARLTPLVLHILWV
jgi:hypothetical protein